MAAKGNRDRGFFITRRQTILNPHGCCTRSSTRHVLAGTVCAKGNAPGEKTRKLRNPVARSRANAPALRARGDVDFLTQRRSDVGRQDMQANVCLC